MQPRSEFCTRERAPAPLRGMMFEKDEMEVRVIRCRARGSPLVATPNLVREAKANTTRQPVPIEKEIATLGAGTERIPEKRVVLGEPGGEYAVLVIPESGG